jgi:uridine kinase
MQDPFIIGIAGGSGSGKTSFIQALMESFSDKEVCLISLDNYYKPKGEQSVDANGIANYDTPGSIEIDQFITDFKKLTSGIEIQKLEYDFNNPAFKAQMLTFKPAPVIVLESVFLFSYKELEDLINLKIFIETQEHLRLKRRILRDLKERGYPVEETLYYLEHHVTPGYAQYVEPYKHSADIIVPNNKNFNRAVEMLVSYIKCKL